MGCRLNIYEGEIIKNHLKNSNLNNITVINSCAVTADAEKKVAYEIRKAKRNNPKNKIIVTGCAAQINPKKYDAISEVDVVLGNKEKLTSNVWKSLNFQKPIQVNDILLEKKTVPTTIEKFDGKSRAYIEIQQGCDHRCTFCIIPYGRGNNRSVPAGEIVERIKKLVKNGYKEVVLTGVDITDYGKDLPGKPTFSNLIKRILKLVPDLEQLRLSSIDCAEIDEEFWDLLYEKKLMPHFHISLQAGNNLILKRMKRRHLREDAILFCEQVRKLRPEVTFGADIIAGFPTESDEHFENSIKLVEECGLTWLHIFPYSKRDGTPAARMPQIDGRIIKSRAEVLRSLGKKVRSKHLKEQIGRKHKVLMESSVLGRTEQFAEVLFASPKQEGSIVDATISDASNSQLMVY